MTKADAETICAFHEGWLVDMDEGRGDDPDHDPDQDDHGDLDHDDDDHDHDDHDDRDHDDGDGAGPQKNNLIKSLISQVDPHLPQIPGMQ